MPYRVVEYTPVHQRQHGRRSAQGRSPHLTVHYGGRIIPRVAHSRLVSVPPPPRFARRQDIYSLGEEAYRLPYRSKVVRIEDLSNYGSPYDCDAESCHDLQYYDAEAEGIRRDASNVLLRLAYGMPTPLYSVNNMPLRSASELRDVVDVRRKFVRVRNNLSSMSRIQSEIYRMAMYQEPLRKPLAGKGNLACLSFAGGRPISKRQLRFYPEDNGIRDVINFRSFYNDLRAQASLGAFYKRPITYHPLYKSKKSLMGIKDDKEEKPRKEPESKWVKRSDLDLPKPEKAVPKPEIPQSYVLPSPRKSIIEFPDEVKTLTESEPEVVVKISRKSIQEDSIVPEVRETIKVASHRVEQEEPAAPIEQEVEEVFEDAQEVEPIVEPEAEEVFKAAPEPEPVEEISVPEPEEEIPEPEPEEEIPKPDEEPEEIIEQIKSEPEVEAEEEPFEPTPEPPMEEPLSPRPGTAESREEEVASPVSEKDHYKESKDEVLSNGHAEVYSGDEKIEEDVLEAVSPPPRVLSDEEAEKVEDGIVENNNYADANEADEVPVKDRVNGDAEAVEVEAEEVEDFWNDDHKSGTQARRKEEDEEVVPKTDQDKWKSVKSDEELESECEESE